MEESKTETPQTTEAQQQTNAFDTAALTAFGGAPVQEGSDDSNLPVENAFFNASEEKTEEAPHQEQAPLGQETPSQDAKNDERRYQYWQSQAAKRQNEVKAMQAELEQLKSNQAAQATTEPKKQAETREEFPPPPPAPKKPARFSREEAWSDASSESAKYLDEKEAWDTDMGQYNELKHQYEIAVMKEKLDEQANFLKNQEQQRQNRIEQGRQMQSISEHVQGHYGLTPTETKEFINTMSDPSSISMDNLVQLFRMNQTQGHQVQKPNGPSDSFRQEQNAQQVPSPMGVLPAQSNQDNRSDEGRIMDELITNHKSKNPWT